MFAIDGLSRTDSVFGSGCLPSLDQIRLFRQVPLQATSPFLLALFDTVFV
ncbi:uncharacterized protein CLAFUR5_20391 [Fulvia fulva]|nr:uncharacterized protein CLAFUR5_20391 [Fulvia fulva]KAK4608886.1 hypothetical protein CLAFUR0_14839 [Fulvia fulva]WMI39108.1 hypothetical protein CLAFUR5_20391 [Fulvia fulva]